MRNKYKITKLSVLITGCFAPGTPGTILGLQLMEIENLEIYGTDTNLVTNAIPNFNAVYQVNNSEVKYLDDVLEIVKKHKIDVILPQTNYETLILSKNISLFDDLCKIALAGEYSTIRFANDKFKVMNNAIKLGIPSSRFINFFEQKELLSFLETIERENQSFYFKGRSESGGRGIVKVLPNNEFLGNLLEKPESIHTITLSVFKEQVMTNRKIFQDFFVMEEFEGDEYTVDVFKTKKNFLAIPRKRVKIRSGVSQINKIEKNESLIYASRVIADSLGLTGLFGFQFIYKDENNFTILECNPRIQGTNFASILAGSNLIEYLVLNLLDREFRVFEPDWNKTFVRTSGGILIETQ